MRVSGLYLVVLLGGVAVDVQYREEDFNTLLELELLWD